MVPEQYVWLVWSGAFLLPWLVVFAGFPQYRKMMLWASLFTAALSGFEIFLMPIEELLFAIGFGAYWSGVYEHFTWRRPAGAQA